MTTAVSVDPRRVRPLRGKVVVRQDPVNRMSASGKLHLPDIALEKPQRGTVVALGAPRLSKDNTTEILWQVAVGDRVLFQKWAGNSVSDAKVMEDGDEGALIVMPETDIVAVLDE